MITESHCVCSTTARSTSHFPTMTSNRGSSISPEPTTTMDQSNNKSSANKTPSSTSSPLSMCQNKKRICSISIVLIIALGIFLWVAGIFRYKNLPPQLKELVSGYDSDPFDGHVYKWIDAYIGGQGLTLTVVNAADSKYDEFFEIGVSNCSRAGGNSAVCCLQYVLIHFSFFSNNR